MGVYITSTRRVGGCKYFPRLWEASGWKIFIAAALDQVSAPSPLLPLRALLLCLLGGHINRYICLNKEAMNKGGLSSVGGRGDEGGGADPPQGRMVGMGGESANSYLAITPFR